MSEAARVITSKWVFANKCELRVGRSVGLSTLKNGAFGLELVLLSLLYTENLVIPSARENQLLKLQFTD